jgi:predicted RNase H-like nuclease (RuvC/YqgF family)
MSLFGESKERAAARLAFKIDQMEAAVADRQRTIATLRRELEVELKRNEELQATMEELEELREQIAMAKAIPTPEAIHASAMEAIREGTIPAVEAIVSARVREALHGIGAGAEMAKDFH